MYLGCIGSPSPNAASDYSVREVLSGDEILVRMPNGEETIYRLWGIDAPESMQSFGGAARKALIKAVDEGSLSLEPDPSTRSIKISGRRGDLSEYLVSAGLAWVLPSETDKSLRSAELAARGRHAGLWSESRLVPPWKFRAASRAESADLVKKRSRVITESKSKPLENNETLACKNAPVLVQLAQNEYDSCVENADDPVKCATYARQTQQLAAQYAHCL